MSDTLKQIGEAWESVLLEMDSKLESFAEKLPAQDGMAADFLELLVFGVPSPELESFLQVNWKCRTFTEQKHECGKREFKTYLAIRSNYYELLSLYIFKRLWLFAIFRQVESRDFILSLIPTISMKTFSLAQWIKPEFSSDVKWPSNYGFQPPCLCLH